MVKSNVSTHDDDNHLQNPQSASPTLAAVAVAVAILAAAWMAAGSIGLWGASFTRVLCFTALLVAVVLTSPAKKRLAMLIVAAATVVLLPLVLGYYPSLAYDTLFVATVAGILAGSQRGVNRLAVAASAWAAAALAVFSVASEYIPAFWQLADSVGQSLGVSAGVIFGHPLWLGSSFAGLDFLVVMLAFYAAWLCSTRRPRRQRAIYAAVAIAAVQFIYLLALAQSENLLAALPDLPPLPSPDPADYLPPDWSLTAALHSLIPWGLPLLAMIGDLLVAAAMMRWTDWQSPKTQSTNTTSSSVASTSAAQSQPNHGNFIGDYLLVILSAILAAASLAFAPCSSNLSGKKIVAYADSDVWTLPQHGSEDLMAADGYGLLPPFVASLGGKFEVSQSLAADDLNDADVLIIIDPKQPLAEDVLERVHDFVRRGGSLLLIAGVADQANFDRRASDELLRPTGLGVRFDIAEPAVPHWRDAVWSLTHPSTASIDQRRNQFGLNLSSSISAVAENYMQNAGRPLIVGRWGWCESGSDMIAAGASGYNAGERLGDVVLAAEAPLGRGTVIVLGDSTSLANIGLVYTHPFAGRLLGYLAGGGANPQTWWRQLISAVLLVALAWLVIAPRVRTDCTIQMNRLAVVSLTLAICLAATESLSHHMSRVIPDGRLLGAMPIAYIDATHFSTADDELWTPRGVGGFAVTLMRNGYMPLALYELAQQRLERAAMLAVIGPTQTFSKSQRRCLRDFVQRGGLLVCAIGAEQSAANQGLLADFDFRVPHTPVLPNDPSPEPAPIGRYPDDFGRALLTYPYTKDPAQGEYMIYTWVHRPWAVACSADPKAQDTLIFGYEGQTLGIAHHMGSGCAVAIGDSHFMLNANLDYVDGRPLDGTIYGLDFWRWFFGRVTGSHDWFPPDRSGQQGDQTATDSTKQSPAEAPLGDSQKTVPDEQTQKDQTLENPLFNRYRQSLPDLNLPVNPLRSDEVPL